MSSICAVTFFSNDNGDSFFSHMGKYRPSLFGSLTQPERGSQVPGLVVDDDIPKGTAPRQREITWDFFKMLGIGEHEKPHVFHILPYENVGFSWFLHVSPHGFHLFPMVPR